MVPNYSLYPYKCPDFHLWKILPHFWANKNSSTTRRQPRTIIEHVWAFLFDVSTWIGQSAIYVQILNINTQIVQGPLQALLSLARPLDIQKQISE